jgi:hypothetical protein
MTDLNELQNQYDEKLLSDAIESGSIPVIVEQLRKLSGNIPPAIILKLADYLDPNRKPIRSGPKQKKKLSFVGTVTYLGLFLYLSENKEEARLFFNHEKEAFALVENSEIYDAVGNFSPKWKYPHAERKRQAVPLPTKGDIKDWFCEMHGISNRTFDKVLARYNKK